MGVLALQLVELAEVPGGGSSERGHILYEDHPSSEHVEVHRVSLERGGPQVVESLCDERHLVSGAATLEAEGISKSLYPRAWSPDSFRAESCLLWVSNGPAGK